MAFEIQREDELFEALGFVKGQLEQVIKRQDIANGKLGRHETAISDLLAFKRQHNERMEHSHEAAKTRASRWWDVAKAFLSPIATVIFAIIILNIKQLPTSGIGGGGADFVYHPADTPTPTATARLYDAMPTPSIIEVTPRPTSSIFEITPTPYPAGFVIIERGRYTPRFVLKVRLQPGVDQRLLETAPIGITRSTQGRVMLANGQVWICTKASEDRHGGQICEGAMLYIDLERLYCKPDGVCGDYRTP